MTAIVTDMTQLAARLSLISKLSEKKALLCVCYKRRVKDLHL